MEKSRLIFIFILYVCVVSYIFEVTWIFAILLSLPQTLLDLNHELYDQVISHSHISYERVMSHIVEILWIANILPSLPQMLLDRRHISYEYVMSHKNESCLLQIVTILLYKSLQCCPRWCRRSFWRKSNLTLMSRFWCESVVFHINCYWAILLCLPLSCFTKMSEEPFFTWMSEEPCFTWMSESHVMSNVSYESLPSCSRWCRRPLISACVYIHCMQFEYITYIPFVYITYI